MTGEKKRMMRQMKGYINEWTDNERLDNEWIDNAYKDWLMWINKWSNKCPKK